MHAYASDLRWESRDGTRWWIDRSRCITGSEILDRIISPFPMAVFLPKNAHAGILTFRESNEQTPHARRNGA